MRVTSCSLVWVLSARWEVQEQQDSSERLLLLLSTIV
jgi:hypothetical protein